MENAPGAPKGTGSPAATSPDPEINLSAREQAIANRETWLRARERATGEHEIQISEREELVNLREAALRTRAEAEHARLEREHLLVQVREANERLVLATLRADELAAVEAEGRRTAELLAAHLSVSEQALRANEHEFRTLANTVPMLAWFAEADGTIAWYNARWYEYTGATEQPDWTWESVYDPVELPRVAAKWQAALASGTPWEDVFRLRRHDGTFRWFLSRAHPLRDAAGTIVRWFGTSVDIDEQKRAEEDAQADSRLKDEFLAMLGHELRNPLTPIVAALEVIALQGGPDGHEREHAIIERQVKHLARLVDDLLDVSRITTGKIPLQREPTELADVLARAIEIASPLVEAHAQELIVDVAPTGLVVCGDATRLGQAIGNVLTNAAKYTAPRGTIVVTAERSGASVTLRIKDNGVGIADEMIPHVFELFTQEPRAQPQSRGGLGLGLAIVRQLVGMHGGHVTAHSEGVGRGSEFVIELPASDLPPTRPTPGAAPDPKALRDSCRILVVDDNRDAAEMVAASLQALGHDVRVAFDGPTALSISASFVPDVVLLDIGLPEMDGYEVAARLRELLWPRDTHFIAITGYGQPIDRRHSEEAGFDRHLVKPVDTATIQSCIAAVTRERPRD